MDPPDSLKQNAVEALQEQEQSWMLLLSTRDGIVSYGVSDEDSEGFQRRCLTFIEEGLP